LLDIVFTKADAVELVQVLLVVAVFSIRRAGQVGIDQVPTIDDRDGLRQARVVALALQAVSG
jgi:hypothetical protein